MRKRIDKYKIAFLVSSRSAMASARAQIYIPGDKMNEALTARLEAFFEEIIPAFRHIKSAIVEPRLDRNRVRGAAYHQACVLIGDDPYLYRVKFGLRVPEGKPLLWGSHPGGEYVYFQILDKKKRFRDGAPIYRQKSDHLAGPYGPFYATQYSSRASGPTGSLCVPLPPSCLKAYSL